MSAETKAALDAAIEAHIIDSTGDHCAAWVIITECTDMKELMEGEASFYIEARDYQSPFLSKGLITTAYERSME